MSEENLKRKAKMLPRKAKKQVTEKIRRDRINGCLEELRSLVYDTQQKEDQGEHSAIKPDKADILEETIKYIKNKMGVDKNDQGFATGYNACALEFMRYLVTSGDIPMQIKPTLLTGMANILCGAPGTEKKEPLPQQQVMTHTPDTTLNGPMCFKLPLSRAHRTPLQAITGNIQQVNTSTMQGYAGGNLQRQTYVLQGGNVLTSPLQAQGVQGDIQASNFILVPNNTQQLTPITGDFQGQNLNLPPMSVFLGDSF